ncbi:MULTISPECIES: cupin domain-containing protein [unclassified Agrobacterium]|uniref:(R)-mandelonitrile lyase n=1 Tax=unclassified Agrobacterium TaxID=2632611 RepID=UPI002448328F|nr:MULTISPECIES: cupin domain-containing protein [unclassified Agrobacterium]MDH0612163.1 cupin domain-containing protein [Agrobacterium sp. GD03872]MDH0696060.1 cupin domain-containing protein [Agrobacterium sp. GD03871]MDH1058666.1 cupin domain-containing protein [Agrobacterium sp. GD03992]MDH2210757.1 cupin domain-containing protein [Agrobacterium sp. GD03643]MDH2217827.1 cupin domain-containing protein [Agrobacterium sp. GD03638]
MSTKSAITAALMLSATAAFAEADRAVSVTRVGSQAATTGSPDNFTGAVKVESRFQATPPARVGGGLVTFEAGARTAWHTHPLGQTLIVTSGSGRVQHWGGEIQQIEPGDTVWIPPGVKHWHGASPEAGMSHIAISETLDGKTVEWLEHVSDEQYRQSVD